MVKDIRDLRDPRQMPDLSRAWRSFPDQGGIRNKRWSSFHEMVDDYMEQPWPNYPGDESTVTITKKEYREELEARAAEGDKYAKSRLDGLPWDEPSE